MEWKFQLTNNHLPGTPYYNETLMLFHCAEDYRKNLSQFVLDEKAIDWVVNVGYFISCRFRYRSSGMIHWRRASLKYDKTFFGLDDIIDGGDIFIKEDLSRDEKNITLVHEILHALIPDIRFTGHGFKKLHPPEREMMLKKYEQIHDEFAKKFAEEESLTNYILKNLRMK